MFAIAGFIAGMVQVTDQRSIDYCAAPTGLRPYPSAYINHGIDLSDYAPGSLTFHKAERAEHNGQGQGLRERAVNPEIP